MQLLGGEALGHRDTLLAAVAEGKRSEGKSRIHPGLISTSARTAERGRGTEGA